MENDKYVVFKSEEFRRWQKGANHIEETNRMAHGEMAMVPSLPMVLSDAIVIRPQDIFAGPGLSAYAASIQTAIDLIKSQPAFVGSAPQIERFEELRDFFWMQAYEALNREEKKIPD